MNIDHIEIDNTSSSSDSDRIQILSATINGNNIDVVFKIGSKLSPQTREYLNDNDNYCYLTTFYRTSEQDNMPGYHGNKEKRHLEKNKWCRHYLSMKQIRFGSGNTFNVSFNKEYFYIESDEHHKYDNVDWNFRRRRFILRLVVGSIGQTGMRTCYSDFNSDEIVVYYTNWR